MVTIVFYHGGGYHQSRSQGGLDPTLSQVKAKLGSSPHVNPGYATVYHGLGTFLAALRSTIIADLSASWN